MQILKFYGIMTLGGKGMSYSAITKEAANLTFSEQLNLLSYLANLISSRQQNTIESKIVSKEKSALESVYALSDSLHLTSNGRGWTREELYER